MIDPITRLNAALGRRYRVARELGEGGMATVYLADDLKHERKVALKVLKPELAAVVGADRFLAEIRTTANLQHPHILPLFDSGEAAGLLFYVMPYVQGESLRERLDREHQLPVDDAIRIATNMAEALDHAHRRGVIHRDIKPANVLLLDGKPLISDFGIALAVSAGGGSRLTETGLSLGTPHYMSPEQATGDQNVGPAADIYALGCVLYEMLVGEPPFTGSTAQAVLGKVVAGQLVAPASQRPTVPSHVDAVIRKALEKVPADRFGSAESLGRALTEPAFSYGGEAATVLSSALRRRPRGREMVSWTLTATLAAALILSLFQPRPPTPSVYDVGLPPRAPIAFTGAAPDGGGEPAFSLSPAGDFVVYTAAQDGTTALWYRSLVDTEARAIAGTSGAYYPMVSPDGRWVAFIREGQLWRVNIAGGAASPLLDGAFSEAHWASVDAILAGGRLVDPVTREVTSLPSSCGSDPFVLESGLMVCGTQGRLVALHPDSSEVTVLRSRDGTAVYGSSPRPVGGGYLSFVTSDGHLQVAPFDVEALAVGRPADVLQGLRREADGGVAHYGVTRDGALVYAPGENAEVGRLVRRRRDASSEYLPVEPATFLTVDVAADGERVAAVVAGLEHDELRIYQLSQGRMSVWLSASSLTEPRWSPSGSRLAVGARFDDDGDWVILIGDPRSGAPPDTIPGSGRPSQFLSEDSLLVSRPVAIVDVGRKPAVVHELPQFRGDWPTLSPGGRWVAFNQSGVVIASYPNGLTRYAATAGGVGQEPVWRSASELTYRLGQAFYTVSVPERYDEPPAAPVFWFDDERFVDTSGRSHAPDPDGGLVYLQTTAASSAGFLRVIPGWADEVSRAADAANR